MGRPNPDGWKGGDEGFEFVRTYDGHISSTDDNDIASRRNARKGLAEADLGNDHYDTKG